MSTFSQIFADRVQEIEAYLDLLSEIEIAVQTGVPRIGDEGAVITTTQQRILYSSVYLQLYNLVEATVTKCIEGVCNAISSDQWRASDLSSDLRREWVRYLARTHIELNYENRLASSLKLCEHLIETLPIGVIEIERGGGGNWNDEEIYKFAVRLGCQLNIAANVNSGVKRPFKNDLGALFLITKLRNDLAHGSVSFGECGADATVEELRQLTELTTAYLSDVVASFEAYIESYSFLHPDSRPQAA